MDRFSDDITLLYQTVIQKANLMCEIIQPKSRYQRLKPLAVQTQLLSSSVSKLAFVFVS